MSTSNESMTIEWDVPIRTSRGSIVRADVFRPASAGRYPVIMTHGVYGKGLPIEQLRHRMLAQAKSHPHMDADRGADLADTFTTTEVEAVADDDYRTWEVVDPTVWVAAGYVCIRVDSRGTGTSEGRLDPMAPDEIDDYADGIEWAGTQEWSNGRVGLCGKSYYAMTQWLVAARRPEHLAAICVWHGLSDWYRDATRHGGILYQFWERFWYPHLVLPVQHGADAGTNPHSGLPIAGATVLDAATLAANRVDVAQDVRDHPFIDEYHRARTPDLSRIDVPLLATADWSDHDLHLRGTIRGFESVKHPQRWLEIHAGGQFDDPDSVELQRRFFDYHLKDETGDWSTQPTIQLSLRGTDGTSTRLDATEWPIPGTTWTPWYLDAGAATLERVKLSSGSSRSYDAPDGDIVFLGGPLSTEETVLGPVSARLYISSSTSDADLFLTVDAVDAEGSIVELRDHRMGLTPLSVGWQRASHRAVDSERSRPGQPFHVHDVAELLEPGEIVSVDVELCPTGITLPAGHRLRLTLSGSAAGHDDPVDRPETVFRNRITLYSGPKYPSQLLIPVVEV
ncbi:CocE/NonD family hydrolase [Plantibacter sp. Mn2098]|uniref:CocE/NonD family hydrolase n=1 Tax=Plantibacter sp. Mn2098 TaxID=3395266 RepID=UPI003BD1E330